MISWIGKLLEEKSSGKEIEKYKTTTTTLRDIYSFEDKD